LTILAKSSEKVKVVHVVKELSHGGIETFLMSMLRNYDRQKFEMDIVYTGGREGKYATEAKQLGTKFIACPLIRDQIGFVKRFCKILREGNYGAANSHISDMSAGAIFAAKLMKVPARVASYHENLYRQTALKRFYRRTLRKIVIKAATDITTSSPGVSQSHFGTIVVPVDMIHPISYGVDTVYFAEKLDRRLNLTRFGFDRSNLIVGHVGRYVVHKNHRALVKIAAKVVKAVPNARFLMCGASTGPLKQDVEKQIAESGLSNYFGMIEGVADIREFYSSIDIFVLPSLLEGMPVSIIEAQAAGKPVVASRLGGIEIATADEMKKNLFAVDDVDAFSKCLIDLLKDKEKRITLGKIGQSYVQKNLDIKIAVRKYEKLYLPKELR